MDNLFVVKEKTIKYKALVLDIENADVITYLRNTFSKNFYWLGENYVPCEELQTISLVYSLEDLNQYDSHEETIKSIFDNIEFDQTKDNIGLYSVMTTNVWRDIETLEYVIGVQLKFTES